VSTPELSAWATLLVSSVGASIAPPAANAELRSISRRFIVKHLPARQCTRNNDSVQTLFLYILDSEFNPPSRPEFP
jgi:hypothetical protein